MNTVLSEPSMGIQPYTEDQNDALQEVVNIAMGQAGDSLARILGNFVELSVPRIRLVTVKDVIKTVMDMVASDAEISVSVRLLKRMPYSVMVINSTLEGLKVFLMNLLKLPGLIL